ncbi:MAG: ABC transporter substrate-binding protein [Cytophagales bacterium]|nr:MAG: ABC transporter substrate-binding protein [Cytophagales bacterium]
MKIRILLFIHFLVSSLFAFQSCQISSERSFKNAPTIGFLDAFQDETIAQAKQGFLDALAKQGFSEKDSTLNVIYRNAQGDITTLTQAADYFASQTDLSLIATNPTLATITMVQKTKQIPVFMMVCGSPSLMGLVDASQKAPNNLKGVYETLEYIATSIELLKTMMPKAQKVGVIYNQAEPQSQNALQAIKEKAKEIGLELVVLPVNNSSETQTVVQTLLSKDIDAFFALPDNVVFASFEVIYKNCDAQNVPIFTSEEGLVVRGAVAGYGADMYQWGYQAGEQAALYLKDKNTKIEPVKVKLHKKVYNSNEAQKYKLKVDNSFTAVSKTK